MGQTGRYDLLRQLLMLGQGTLHQSDGFAERHTVTFEDAVNLPFQRHQLLMVALQALQSVRIDLDGTVDSFGDFEVRFPFMFLIFKVFVFHGGLRFDLAKVGFFIFICVIPKKMRNFVVSKQDYSP